MHAREMGFCQKHLPLEAICHQVKKMKNESQKKQAHMYFKKIITIAQLYFAEKDHFVPK